MILNVLLLNTQIIQIINDPQRKTVGLWLFPGVAKVFEVLLLYFVVKYLRSVFPYNVDEAALGKLPGISHINVEEIDIVIRVVGFGSIK